MKFLILYKHHLYSSIKNKKLFFVVLSYFILLLLFVFISGKIQDGMKNSLGNKILLEEIQERFGDIRILIPYAISLLLIPIITLINNFNYLVNDINNGSLRYLIIRAKRFQIYLAMVLSEFTYIGIAIILSIAIILTYLFFKGFSFGNFIYILLPILVLLFYAFVFISLFTMINVFSKNQFSSLFYCLISLVLLIFFMQNKFLKYISAFYYVPDLLGSEENLQIALKLFGMLAFVIIFNLIGLYLFDRRDL